MEFSEYLKNDRGVALVAALMLLVLLTVLGLAAISTTSTEIKLTANQRTNAQAFNAAESGIKELLFRATLANLGALSIVNGGSMADPDGTGLFDAVIDDPFAVANGVPDPNWQFELYFSGVEPGDDLGASIYRTRTIMENDVWSALNYSGSYSGNLPLDNPVVVRYVTEQDLCGWGINPCDLNLDNDTIDLVYYDEVNNNPPARVAGGPGVTDIVDVLPPVGLNRNLAIRLITATGRSGNATKRIMLETTGFPVDPNVDAAVLANAPVTFGGAGFVSGYNHKIDTTRNDENNYADESLYDNNGCNNYSKADGNGACGIPDDDGGNSADYSGMWETYGHKAAVVTSDTVTTQGNAVEAWGSDTSDTDTTKHVGWKKEGVTDPFPSLAEMLGVDESVVIDMKAGANTDPDVCPKGGITYIDNANSPDKYFPKNAANCDTGSGILWVTGDMKISGNFEFRGLIYVEGDVELRGSVFMLGALAVKGEGGELTVSNGTPTILYSQQTVVNAVTAALNKVGFAFTKLSWREVE